MCDQYCFLNACCVYLHRILSFADSSVSHTTLKTCRLLNEMAPRIPDVVRAQLNESKGADRLERRTTKLIEAKRRIKELEESKPKNKRTGTESMKQADLTDCMRTPYAGVPANDIRNLRQLATKGIIIAMVCNPRNQLSSPEYVVEGSIDAIKGSTGVGRLNLRAKTMGLDGQRKENWGVQDSAVSFEKIGNAVFR